MLKDDKISNTEKKDAGNIIGGIAKAMGLVMVYEMGKGFFNSGRNEFYRIALTHFPETTGEWARAEADIVQKQRAISMFESCKNASRKDCVSIYLAASCQTYFEKYVTSDERKFITEYDKAKINYVKK